jgi:hypothetical protein
MIMQRTAAAGFATLALLTPLAQAQEYSRFISCSGSMPVEGRQQEAHVDFALQSNNRSALVQRSNVLPVGAQLRYVPTPANYAMTYLLRARGTQVIVVPGWLQNSILVAVPNLKRLNQIRLSINRQTGLLDGRLLNEEDEVLGTLAMQCQSRSEEQVGAPKF